MYCENKYIFINLELLKEQSKSSFNWHLKNFHYFMSPRFRSLSSTSMNESNLFQKKSFDQTTLVLDKENKNIFDCKNKIKRIN